MYRQSKYEHVEESSLEIRILKTPIVAPSVSVTVCVTDELVVSTSSAEEIIEWEEVSIKIISDNT